MDRRERIDSDQEALIAAIDGARADIWTAIPGIIQEFDPVEKVCTVQPSIQARLTDITNGEKTWVNLPLLKDCPVYFPSGGGCTLTFPIKKDDECLIIFASRCIDGWWQDGGIQQQIQIRMHDLSDGFVFVGISSVKKVQPDINTDNVQLRSDDGSTYIELDPENQKLKMVAPGGIKIIGNVELEGQLHSTEDIIADNISLQHHVHDSVQSGSSNTGEPVE